MSTFDGVMRKLWVTLMAAMYVGASGLKRLNPVMQALSGVTLKPHAISHVAVQNGVSPSRYERVAVRDEVDHTLLATKGAKNLLSTSGSTRTPRTHTHKHDLECLCR